MFMTGKINFQCHGCGMRGKKAASHEQAAENWNQRISKYGEKKLT